MIQSAVFKAVLTGSLFLFLSLSGSLAAIRYVKPGSAGTAPYTSWATASNDLQAVINQCLAGDEIWIAAGTYKPNRRADAVTVITATDRNNAFVLKNNVKIYGGFTGTETLVTQRSLVNVVLLSGDIGTVGTVTDNCYHVVISAGLTGANTLLDGIRITAGNANAAIITPNITVNTFTVSPRNGGGVYKTNAITDFVNCHFQQNNASGVGGALYENTSSSATGYFKCIISNNSSSSNGGGAFLFSSSSIFDSCTVSTNSAVGDAGGFYTNGTGSVQYKNGTIISNDAGGNGGGVANLSTGTVTISSTRISGNDAGSTGGAVYSLNATTLVWNCLLSGNEANGGGALWNASSAGEIINCTISGNNSLAQGGAIGNGFSNPIIRNSIIYNNSAVPGATNSMFNSGSFPVVEFCIVEGGYAGIGNLAANPLFVSSVSPAFAPTSSGNYQLQKCSPAINAGNNSWVPAGIFSDLLNGDRFALSTVDMGAYEYNVPYAVPDLSGIVYVDSAKNGNGSSWANAVKELSDALIAARFNTGITQIWVAKGTYRPVYASTYACSNMNSANTFRLVNNVKLYGSFTNGETDTLQRNFTANSSILSGNIGDEANSIDNCNNVIMIENIVSAHIDGFSISNASGHIGGGLLNSNSFAKIKNCRFLNNFVTAVGGAIAMTNSGGIELSDCFFQNNTANGLGGGGIYGNPGCTLTATSSVFLNNYSENGAAIHITDASGLSVIKNCKFSGNEAQNLGGALCSHNRITVINSLFSGNKSSQGGAMHLSSGSSYAITGCTIAGNLALNSGSAIFGDGAQPSIDNSIVYNNAGGALFSAPPPVIGYSNIQGGYAGTANISADPQFVNPLAAAAAPTISGDYHLQKCSPAINAGSNAAVPAGITKDLDSLNRIHLGIVDMGAYEKFLAKPNASGIVYVDSSNTLIVGDGSSWAQAVTELADAMKEAKTNTAINEIWVAKGTYKPIYNAADTYLNSICHSTDRDASFVLVPDVKLYGGFAGGETSLAQRNINANPVSLSGDIGIINNDTDNAYNVVIGAGDLADCVVDGFSVEYGKCADDNVSSKTVNGEIIGKGNGAGIYLNNASLVFQDCAIRFNSTNSSGGGLYSEQNSSPVFRNCSISGNKAARGGGAYINQQSMPSFYNCKITGNVTNFTGSHAAGLTFSANSGGAIKNCTIAGNYSYSSNAGIYTLSPLYVTNSIILGYRSIPAGISSVSFCCIYPGGHSGLGNIDLDPRFLFLPSPVIPPFPTISGDYRLQPCSPAINAGNNDSIPVGITIDLDSLNRIMFGTVDMGAYEKQDVDLANTTWKGVNNNWNDKINWCGGYIPVDTTNVTVPLTVNQPVIVAGFSNEVKNILLANSTSMSIASTGSFTINGKYTNLGASISNNGTWKMSGDSAAQQLPGGGTVNAMHNLTIDNSAGLQLNKSFQITGTLTPLRGMVNINNAVITLNSDAVSTARVDSLRSATGFTYSNGGKFSIERYLSAKRAWRFLTAPVKGSSNLTISNAWQESTSNSTLISANNPYPGFGTTITKSTVYNATNGFDVGVSNIPSLKYFSGGGWNGFPSSTTGTTTGANNGLITDQQGYMLFFRGSRQTLVGISSPVTESTLRPSGEIKTGNQTVVCNGWTVIGNPYPSSINFHQLVLDNPGLPDAFYVWDPNLAGAYNVGGWITYGAYNNLSGTYTITPILPGSSAASNTGDIPSGSAFMINYYGTITIKENHKSSGLNNALMREERQLRLQLYAVGSNGSTSLVDAVVICFSGRFKSRNNSVPKNTNFTENFSIADNGQQLAIQTRALPERNDTIYLSTSQMRQQNYEFRIKASEMQFAEGKQMYLEDRFTRKYASLSLTDTTFYRFAVTADPASAAANRFRIILRKPGTISGQSAETAKPVSVSTYKNKRANNLFIYPNPVLGKNLQLHLEGVLPGKYGARIFSSDGKLLLIQTWQQQFTDGIKTFSLKKLIPGHYKLEIEMPDKSRKTISVEME
ncbi:MAG: choice-of-anchor Q domain-containing protein [Ferruginibacter sp.]